MIERQTLKYSGENYDLQISLEPHNLSFQLFYERKKFTKNITKSFKYNEFPLTIQKELKSLNEIFRVLEKKQNLEIDAQNGRIRIFLHDGKNAIREQSILQLDKKEKDFRFRNFKQFKEEEKRDDILEKLREILESNNLSVQDKHDAFSGEKERQIQKKELVNLIVFDKIQNLQKEFKRQMVAVSQKIKKIEIIEDSFLNFKERTTEHINDIETEIYKQIRKCEEKRQEKFDRKIRQIKKESNEKITSEIEKISNKIISNEENNQENMRKMENQLILIHQKQDPLNEEFKIRLIQIMQASQKFQGEVREGISEILDQIHGQISQKLNLIDIIDQKIKIFEEKVQELSFKKNKSFVIPKRKRDLSNDEKQKIKRDSSYASINSLQKSRFLLDPMAKKTENFIKQNNVIEYIGSSLKWNQFLIGHPIPRKIGIQKFKFKILQTKNRLMMIGIVDKNKQEHMKNSYDSGNAICYSGQGRVHYGNIDSEYYWNQQGKGFKRGEQVCMMINLEAGNIVWKINNEDKAMINSSILKDQKKQLVVYVQMKTEGDKIECLF